MSETEYPEARTELPDASGSHAAIGIGMWRNQGVRATCHHDYGGALMVDLYIGDLTLALSVEQWRVLADTVDAVLPQGVPA